MHHVPTRDRSGSQPPVDWHNFRAKHGMYEK
ncbi:MAG: hypothetical protein ACI9R3_004813 [Verrucomicrobiales bacterium]|jgi:hypothetical protein